MDKHIQKRFQILALSGGGYRGSDRRSPVPHQISLACSSLEPLCRSGHDALFFVLSLNFNFAFLLSLSLSLSISGEVSFPFLSFHSPSTPFLHGLALGALCDVRDRGRKAEDESRGTKLSNAALCFALFQSSFCLGLCVRRFSSIGPSL